MTTNAKHTPGPWQPSSEDDTLNLYIVAPDGDRIAVAFEREGVTDAPVGETEDWANARLIAAAPDLLAAAEAALGLLYDGTPDSDVSPLEQSVRQQLQAAIAAAKGE